MTGLGLRFKLHHHELSSTRTLTDMATFRLGPSWRLFFLEIVTNSNVPSSDMNCAHFTSSTHTNPYSFNDGLVSVQTLNYDSVCVNM